MTTISTRNLRLGILLVLLTCLSACGQKGDLYLPPEVNNNEIKNSFHV